MTSDFRRIPVQTIKNCDWNFNGQNAVLSDRSSGPNKYEAVIHSSDLLHKFSLRHEAFALNTSRIGQPEFPTGAGYMHFSGAVYWIATEGGKKNFWIREERVWRVAVETLLDRVAGGQVAIIGRRSVNEPSGELPGTMFAALEIDLPYSPPSFPLIVGDQPYLEVTPPLLSNSEWQQWNDRIHSNRSVTFSHIQVRRPDVARLWPFGRKFDGTAAPDEVSNVISAATSGRGKQTAAVLAAFKKVFPSGIPVGMSSQTRNDRILEELTKMGVKSLPVTRTIERALKGGD